MRRAAMLPQIDALPCSKGATSVRYRDRYGGLRENAADMSWHVIGALGSVLKHAVAIWGDLCHEALKVSTNCRIRVLADNQRGTGVVHKDVAQPPFDTRGRDTASNLGRDLGGSATRCGNCDGLGVNAN